MMDRTVKYALTRNPRWTRTVRAGGASIASQGRAAVSAPSTGRVSAAAERRRRFGRGICPGWAGAGVNWRVAAPAWPDGDTSEPGIGTWRAPVSAGPAGSGRGCRASGFTLRLTLAEGALIASTPPIAAWRPREPPSAAMATTCPTGSRHRKDGGTGRRVAGWAYRRRPRTSPGPAPPACAAPWPGQTPHAAVPSAATHGRPPRLPGGCRSAEHGAPRVCRVRHRSPQPAWPGPSPRPAVPGGLRRARARVAGAAAPG